MMYRFKAVLLLCTFYASAQEGLNIKFVRDDALDKEETFDLSVGLDDLLDVEDSLDGIAGQLKDMGSMLKEAS